jgi:hypothetical protein
MSNQAKKLCAVAGHLVGALLQKLICFSFSVGKLHQQRWKKPAVNTETFSPPPARFFPFPTSQKSSDPRSEAFHTPPMPEKSGPWSETRSCSRAHCEQKLLAVAKGT